MMTAPYQVADTDPQAIEVWLDALRRLTPGEKMRLVLEMIEFTHQLALRQIREECLGISERDMLRELATRRYGRELAERAYPRDSA
jgi:hypothetical protein